MSITAPTQAELHAALAAAEAAYAPHEGRDTPQAARLYGDYLVAHAAYHGALQVAARVRQGEYR